MIENGKLIPIAGGDINLAFRLEIDDSYYFVKKNKPDLLGMFQAEAEGLKALAEIGAIRIPKVIETGVTASFSFIILEYLDLHPLQTVSAIKFGEQLAQLHAVKQPYFGWKMDNTIGSTLQSNSKSTDWVKFWKKNRLLHQISLLKSKNAPSSLIDKGIILSENLNKFFVGYTPYPSLLHGDLWSGNAASFEGEPVIFDPACYFGDRETDIAMTQLFGGFGAPFLDVYQSNFPLDHGFEMRKDLYNLYHILNHANLFGGGYMRQAECIMDALLVF